MVHFIEKRLQVFVSSTYLDLKDERQAAVKAILESGHIPAGMELFTSGDESQMEVIKQWIKASDVYLLILGGRYGSIEKNSGKSYTHLEYEYASELGKPFFACIMKDDYLEEKIKSSNVNSTDIREQYHPQRLQDFKDIVMSKMVFQCNSLMGIENSILKKMGELGRRDDLTGWIRSDESADSTLLSTEVARLSKENHDLREEINSMGIQSPSIITFNGISFDAIVKSLKTVLLHEEDFAEPTSGINDLFEKNGFQEEMLGTKKYFVVELFGAFIKRAIESEPGDALDLIDALSRYLLATTALVQKKMKTNSILYEDSLYQRMSFNPSPHDFEYLCVKQIMDIPKLKIFFDFGILDSIEGFVLVSDTGKEIIKCIKARKAQEMCLGSSREL
jgi:Domain of unknown function (DUF4062)